MFRTLVLLVVVFSIATPAIADEASLPPNTIDCRQFKKTGPQEWSEAGIAVFDVGEDKEMRLGVPVTPLAFNIGGFDLYQLLEKKCGTSETANIATTAIAGEASLPPNTIDCRQFNKTGPQEWRTAGIAVFDVGEDKEMRLGVPVTPLAFKIGGIDLYQLLEKKCGTSETANKGVH